jgi:hypothetical protein
MGAVLPLFLHDTLPRGDDVGEHVQFAQDFSAGLAEGRLYPRWLGHANLGYGAPAFVFYPPLATAVVSLIHLTGLHLFTAFRATYFLLTLAAALSAALLGSRLAAGEDPSRRRLAGALTGALLVLLPYHAIDIFNRFALAETATFVFLPILFAGLESRGRRRLPLLAAAFAGLCLSHLPTAYLAGLVALVWTVAREHRRLPQLLSALLLGTACASVYVLPSVAERGEIHSAWLEENPHYRFDAHYLFFPSPVEYENDPIWGDLEAHLDSPTLRQVRRAAPFTLIIALAAWGSRRLLHRRRDPPADPLHRYAVLALCSFLGMTRLAHPAWSLVPGLPSVAFPWRLSLLLTLAAAVLTGVALVELWQRRRLRLAISALAFLAASFPLAAALSAASALSADWQLFTREHARSPIVRLRSTGALMPAGNPRMRGFRRRGPAGPPVVRTLEGQPAGTVEVVLDENHHREYRLDVGREPALLEVATFDYPGWRAYLNGVPVPHTRSPDLGTLRLAVPKGDHRVAWIFEATPTRRLAAVVSGLSVLLLLGLTVYPPGRTMPRRRAP